MHHVGKKAAMHDTNHPATKVSSLRPKVLSHAAACNTISIRQSNPVHPFHHTMWNTSSPALTISFPTSTPKSPCSRAESLHSWLS